MREGGASDSSHAAKIERHGLRPKLVVGRRERSPPDERTSIVDQNVEAAEKSHRLSHDSLDLFGRIEIASPRGTAPSEHAGFVNQRLCRLRTIAVVHENVAAGEKQ